MFARLKQVRLEIANAEGVQAFVVFHDRSLQDMAARNPQCMEELAACQGVGAHKLERSLPARLWLATFVADGYHREVETGLDDHTGYHRAFTPSRENVESRVYDQTNCGG